MDADRVGHEVLAPDGPAFEEVAARWPSVLVDGAIDRRALGRIVFADPSQLAELEAITHPLIRGRLAALVAGADGPVVVEIPIPVGWLPDEWPVVVVDAPDDLRRERLAARGMDPDEIVARMAAQPSREAWLAMADHVVDNRGDRSALTREVARLVEVLGDVPA